MESDDTKVVKKFYLTKTMSVAFPLDVLVFWIDTSLHYDFPVIKAVELIFVSKLFMRLCHIFLRFQHRHETCFFKNIEFLIKERSHMALDWVNIKGGKS